MVNEAALKEFKWGTPEQALGKTINREGKKGKVVGVISDFNFTALTTAISALILSIDETQFNTLSIKFDSNNPQLIVTQIQKEWDQLFPEKAFEYTFLEEQLNQQYSNYQNFGSIIQSFSAIAILIASLGVYGLVLFTVQRKVKEIGVRKVLGASVQSVLALIYRDFALLVLTGFIIAVPVSYYLLKEWLNNFIYHTTIDITMYAVSFLMVLIVVSLAIGYQVLKAAQGNPVDSLRSE
jgi:putative ABC transport system permease protein